MSTKRTQETFDLNYISEFNVSQNNTVIRVVTVVKINEKLFYKVLTAREKHISHVYKIYIKRFIKGK